MTPQWWKWKQLAQNMHEAGIFNEKRIHPKRLYERFRHGFAGIVLDSSNTIIGFAALWQTGISDVLELGSFFVLPGWRGRGIGREVFGQCVRILEDNKARAVAFTESAELIRLASRFGWSVDSTGQHTAIRLFLAQGACFEEARQKRQHTRHSDTTMLCSWNRGEACAPEQKTYYIYLGSC